MPSIFQAERRAEIDARLDRLSHDSPRRWGRMNAGQMVCHLTESMRMALGEVSCAPRGGPLSFPPLRWLVINVLPFPRGVPTAPELLAGTPAGLDDDRRTLRGLLDRVVALGAAGPFPPHPAFGAMRGEQWGVLIYRHFDHHLRQFGV